MNTGVDETKVETKLSEQNIGINLKANINWVKLRWSIRNVKLTKSRSKYFIND